MSLPSIETIVIIGSGNVATHFSRAIKKAGKKIIQIYSKHPKSAKQLSKEYGAESVSSLNDLRKDADLYLLAVTDNAIEEVALSLELKNRLIVHTAGSVSDDVLKKSTPNYGVIYPLQTFSANIPVEWKKIPVFIEASSKENEKKLLHFASLFSDDVHLLSSEKRKMIHLAAVFVNNFVNYIYSVAANMMNENKLSFDFLKPLILETAERIMTNSPVDIQTGPAIRGDKKVIKEHIKLLSKHPDQAQLYKYLSEMIMKQTQKKQINNG
jgi:predicted short-subunit dehydrogenase-like oxidoreductase (DUF2520 family)